MKKEVQRKINAPATRAKVCEKYGSLRAFARLCQDTYGYASLESAYRSINQMLVSDTGRRTGISKLIRQRLEEEGLLVVEDDDQDEAING